MNDVRTVAALIGCLTIAACGGSHKLEPGRLDAFVRQTITNQIGASVKSVICPPDRRQKKGDTFDCAVHIDQGSTQVTITQTDGRGGLALSMRESIVKVVEVEKAIATAIKTSSNLDAVVDCGARFRPSTPGESFECTGRAGTQEARYRATIKDGKGTVTYETLSVGAATGVPATESDRAAR